MTPVSLCWSLAALAVFAGVGGLLLPLPLAAVVQPAALFTDHAVLQRGLPLPVWGTADAQESVRVSFAGQSVATTADNAGQWRVTLQPVTETGPHKMTISGSGGQVTIEDVLIGEVWLCSGQSNMQWSLKQALNGEQEVAAATQPSIRLFNVPRTPSQAPADALEGKWARCEPANAADFSAVAYFFGRDLSRKLDCPVGLIHASWGGTVAKPWMPIEALRTDPRFDVMMEREAERLRDLPEAGGRYEKAKVEWDARRAAAPESAGPAPLKPTAATKGGPAHLYNGMIHPLIPYAIRGVAWYQGESNRNGPEQYRLHLPALINSWRSAWNQADPQFGRDYPFLVVQIANYLAPNPDPNVPSPWAEIREVQRLTALEERNVALIVTIDLGEEKSIHPLNKAAVGRRLALAAGKLAYQQAAQASGPTMKTFSVRETEAIVTFENVGGGLVAKDDRLDGFVIAGADRRFHPASAKIRGDTVVLSSPTVSVPAAVRYLWADNPPASLYNQEGLPASPFQTDPWPRTR